MSNTIDLNFNKNFVREKYGCVSLKVVAIKLDIDESSAEEFLKSKNIEIQVNDGKKFLKGWKYRDDAKTPLQVPVLKSKDYDIKKDDTSQQLMEEYKSMKIKSKNKENDLLKQITFLNDKIKDYESKLSELEESHRIKIDEIMEKISLGQALNKKINDILDKTKSDLERLSNKEVEILILVDFHDKGEISKRHSRTYFIPKNQNYSFEIGHELKHENPDLCKHFN